ncbi:hypothetical protein SBV1_360034 [Verrucomicrobia bacterium]|nr:hypothetical protein SBV1_360034 [Verrucomicrobiota bacterium]
MCKLIGVERAKSRGWLRRALQWDSLVPADKINVPVSKGWVTLKGEVNLLTIQNRVDRRGREI